MFDSTTKFPHHFDIDYIRVYQLNNDCDRNFVRNNTITPQLYIPRIWKNIVLNKGISTASVPTKTVMRATDSITLQPELNYPLGTEFMMIPTECTEDQGNFSNDMGTYKKKYIPDPPPAEFYSARLKKR
jgi:hypothetical protein